MLSLIFWSMMIVVTLKYVVVIMRADNKGEGGSLALLALIKRKTSEGGKSALDRRHRPARRLRLLRSSTAIHDHAGHLGAVGGRGPDDGPGRASSRYVVPIALGILVGLFMIQAPARRGSAPCSGRSCSSIS